MIGEPARDDLARSAEWIDTPEGLADVIRALRSEPRYALDTEFHRERTYFPKLALVQLAWPGRLVLVDPLAVDLAPFAEVLEGPAVAVLHAADQDLEILQLACGRTPARLFDTQVAAGFLGFSSASLVSLVERLIGARILKGDRLTDWIRRPLTDSQRLYAASDVLHLLQLHDLLIEKLEGCGRLSWAEDECQRLLERARSGQDPETAWWRIKDSRSLRGPARGIAQELAAWRERRAAELDRPSRMVLSDMALLGIANRRPSGEQDLKDIRGLDARQLKGAALAGVLEAVRTGAALGKDQVRVPPVDDFDRQLRPAVTLVSAWVGQLALDLRIDPALLATRADLQAFLRSDPGGRLAAGWRRELVGEPIRRLVEGDAALAFRPGRGDLVLEARSREEIVVQAAVPDFATPETPGGEPEVVTPA
ncbi:MAG: Ribonuclease D [uncultured Acidimicrobiales bacterium]|uniref:Ribonuclease D n=1 Tax=uncultured Acidimicrobiales bacterium TaxID=310071 RepID=A0A6J4H6T6_9ACTN|nr:MAG: Ribonuclease D [uncultured Acidimicrobiales bacterium]